jgi:ribosomal 50S subunit-recycling heat shock protein
MRLDLFLKESRLIKRRTKAKNYCEEGNVLIDDVPAKASKTVKVGDVIEIDFPYKTLIIKIISLLDKGTPKNIASDSYKILDEKEKSIWD